MPYFNKQRGTWTAQVIRNGKKYRTQHSTIAEASAWEDAKRAELQGILPMPRISTLYQWAVAYLDYAQIQHVEKTYKEKRSVLHRFFQSIDPHTAPEDLHRGGVLTYFQRQSAARSGYAANKDRKNLLSAWNWAAQYLPDWPQDNPFHTVKMVEERSPRYVPPEKDFWAVYEVAESEQDRLMLLCYLHLAARRTEIFHLRREDVDLDRKRVRLYTRKRRGGSLHHDWLPMTEPLRKAFSAYLPTISGPWVFPDPCSGLPYHSRQKWLPRLCELARVPKFGLHSIRHLSASILVSHQVPLLDVQATLRHLNLTTTQRYVHRIETGCCLVSVFDSIHQRGNCERK